MSKLELIFQHTYTFISSKWFVYATLTLFAIQCVLFALTMGYGILPDEDRHFAYILYYAHLPLLSGPDIHHQPVSAMWIGDMERFPSFLYYYIASFMVRIVLPFITDETDTLYMVRLVSVVMGIVSLWIFRKILLELRASKVVANLAILGLSMTGMFVFINVTASYDPPSILLFLTFLYMGVRLIRTKQFIYLLYATLLALAVSITKYTFLPLVGVASLVLAIYYAMQASAPISSAIKEMSDLWARAKVLVVALGVGTVIVATLFTSRFGVNLVYYHSFNPPCQKVHTHDECLNFAIYARNYDAQQGIIAQTAQYGKAPSDLFTLSGEWLESMYRTVYFFGGQVVSFLDQTDRAVFFVLFALIAIILLAPRQPVATTLERKFVFGITFLYMLMVYAFNLQTWFRLGAKYAWQGRYLLPIIGFIYFLLLLIYQQYWHKIPIKYRSGVGMTGVVFLTALLFYYSPTYMFITHGGLGWLNYPAQQLLMAIW